ncbi:MAG: cation:proton antiporter [Promethearchaeota archaeon]
MMGFIIAIYNFFPVENIFLPTIPYPEFNFCAQIGMYFLLFVIGFEIDLREIKTKSKFILMITCLTILFCTIFGSSIIFIFFGYGIFVSIIIGLSFSTVGEEILIPILDEFNMTNEALGQTIIGVGSIDDIFEVISLILVILFVGSESSGDITVIVIIASLFVLFALAIILMKLKKESRKFSFKNIETLFLFVIFILFLFLGIGTFSEATSLAALLAEIALKTFLPKKRIEAIENEIKTICYGFFAPIFFVWVGASMNITYLLNSPIIIGVIVITSMFAKLLGSYIGGRKKLGKKDSILLGTGLSVKFSTSIVVITILLDNGIIDDNLYSIIVASSMILTIIVPILFSNLIARWNKPVNKKMKNEKIKNVNF